MASKSTTQFLLKLRALFKDAAFCRPPVKAYIISTGDSHQSEYLADCDKRIPFISGFTGSRGTAVITEKEAAMWVDGRYYVQAEQQLDENWTLMKEGLTQTPSQAKWLSQKLAEEDLIGIDPFLLTANKFKALSEEVKNGGQILVPVSKNLVDAAWVERPARPANTVFPLELEFTGRNLEEKVMLLRNKLDEEKAEAIIVEALDEVAYLFNLRGSDIDFNPVFFSYGIITMTEIFLLTDESRISTAAKKKMDEAKVQVLPYENLESVINELVSQSSCKVWIPGTSSQAVNDLVPKERRISMASPIALMKAVKNETERQGMRNAHIRDGAALCRYLCWLEKEVGKGVHTEISASDVLEQLRGEQESYVGLSFETISSVGSNAAIIHYKSTPETDRLLSTSEIYLVDSGGQYKDGTTDVTRTVHFGTPSDFERECFTRVLKGMIALASAVFPNETKGNHLDSLARQYLWEVGLDYGHGTGHGIGMFLNVHEGPMGITFRPMDDPGIVEGMFLSDEPGYYEDGKFGIRIENIVEVVKADTPNNHRDVGFLTFKTITMAPIQRKMIQATLLTKKEIDWINDYHTEVMEKVGPLLLIQGHKHAYEWLSRQTAPMS